MTSDLEASCGPQATELPGKAPDPKHATEPPTPAIDADPFVAFTEWSEPADEADYADLS